MVALGRREQLRQEDLDRIRPALEYALTLESQGSKLAEAIIWLLERLPREAGAESVAR